MKIAIDISQIIYSGTGVGRYVNELARALVRQGEAEFIFYAGALRQLGSLRTLSQEAPLSKASWRLTPFSPRVADLLFNKLGLSIDPFVGSVDIFHSSDWTQPGSRAIKVTTVHDLAFKLYPETIDPLILHTQERRMARVIQDADLIIADSLSTKNDLVKIYRLDNTRIKVVYPGINSQFTKQSIQEIERVKKAYHLPVSFILSVGTQEPRKNLSRLVDAAQIAGLPLVLVGRHGWGEQTQTLGYVPDADLPALYSAATVFAYPSLYEGFGFPVGEAMACGTSVVTSNVSSLPEVGGDAAVLVDPNSVQDIARGIKQVVKERESRVKAGFEQVAKFTWDNTARNLLSIYQEVVNENRH